MFAHPYSDDTRNAAYINVTIYNTRHGAASEEQRVDELSYVGMRDPIDDESHESESKK